MSIFGADYEYRDILEITDDLDMNEYRIKELSNPQSPLDAVNKKYLNRRIEYKTKDLEDKLTKFKSDVENVNNDTLQRLRIFSASIQKNKEQIVQLNTEIESLESLPTDSKDIRILSSQINANKTRLERINNDLTAYCTAIENQINTEVQVEITALQQLLDGTRPFSSDLDMGNNRITNVAHPRNPADNSEYESDLVTAKFLYDYIKIADRKFLKTNEDNVINGRLDLNQHKIINLGDPVSSGDAVTLRYVASRFQALADENIQIRSRMDRLERLFQQ